MSRFAPGSDGRYPARDRTPPPRFERRGSNQYDSAPAGRPLEASTYRPGESYAGPPPRDAPRAPKAAQDGGSRGTYGSQDSAGRSNYGSKSRGRESSYPRDAPFPRRREKDEWAPSSSDADSWHPRRPSPVNTGRARSRSPPPARDFRDKDNANPRGRDGPLSASSAGSEAANVGGYFARGGGGSYRGRGRSEYDGRSRGRGPISEERDSYKSARSRSREPTWRDRERDYRDDRSREGDRDHDRDGDRYRRDAPLRPSSRNSGGSQTNPSTPLTANPVPNPISTDRWRDNAKQSTPSGDTSRRQSFASGHDPRPDFRASTSARAEATPTAPAGQAPSPPPPSQGPLFGPMGNRSSLGSQPGSSSQPVAREEQPASKPKPQDPILNAPRAPKAELQIPTGPRASAPFARRSVPGPGPPGHRHDAHSDVQNLQNPSLQRFGQNRPPGVPGFAPPTQPHDFGHWASPTFSSRQPPSEGTVVSPSSHEPVTSPSSFHPGLPGKHVPTGPRAQQQPSIRASMNRPTEPAAMAAARRTSLQPKGPSIMRTMIPSKRDSVGEERVHLERRSSGLSNDKEPRRASASILGSRDHGSSLGSVYAEDGTKMDVETDTPGADGESVDQPDESDEDDLSEEDDEERERIYRKNIENLEAKRPPSPSHHPELLLLLEELNALAAAAEDRKKGIVPPLPPEDEDTSRPAIGLPSPTSEGLDPSKEEDDALAKLDEASVSEELPIDGLPFLSSRPLTPVSDVVFLEPTEEREGISSQIVLEAIARERKDEEREWDRLRRFFAEKYKPFRALQEAGEDEKRREEDLKKAVSPQPGEDPSKDPTPASSRRRDRSAFSTQADENAAIQASKESYEKEQKEREERELQETAQKEELPDLTREAVIPDMYRLSDRRADIFEDTNHIIETRLVLEAFHFTTPPDDFTEEEQEKFIEAYVTTPKKWGHIAREIPGRTYQDCIRHYYLTKKEVQYKLIADRRKTKRGRGKKVAVGRPKASALLSDIHRGEGAPGADELTDAGRPKRAAAPVSFGEPRKTLADVSGKATPGRKTANAARASEAGDSSSDKPAGRGTRGGRAASNRKEGGPRGRGAKNLASATASGNTSNNESTKAPSASIAAPLLAPGPSPQKGGTESPRRSKSVEGRTDEQARSRELDSAASLVSMHNATVVATPALVPAAHTEPWRDARPVAAPPPPADARQGPTPSRATEAVPPPTDRTPSATAPAKITASGKPQPSSYWSVAEIDMFHQLIPHYGTDWHMLASFLITKTHTMVKNFYNRQIEKGDKPELEQLADEANKRNRELGGPPVNPPVTMPLQSAQPALQRRRPEPPPQQLAPQPAAQRPLAPSSEAAEAESDPARVVAAQAAPYGGSRAHLVPIRQAAPQSSHPGAPTEAMPLVRQPSQEKAPRAAPPIPGAQPYYPVEQRERRPDEAEARPGPPLDQERFTSLLSAQHAQAHEPSHGVPPPPRESLDPYAGRAPLAPHQHQPAAMMASRTPQMPLAELDRGQRAPAPYQPGPSHEHTPPELRRDNSYPHERYRPAQRSPHSHTSQPPPPPPRSYGDTSRPSSVPQHASAAPVPTPAPEPRPAPPPEKKRSNIMMMLNDDPPEPPPAKAPPPPVVAESRAPAPHRATPPTSVPMYQPPAQPQPQPPYGRREHIAEPVAGLGSRHHEPPRHAYSEASYGAHGGHAGHAGHAIPHQQPERREPASWGGMSRSYYGEQPRHGHGYGAAASPQPQPSYLPPGGGRPPPPPQQGPPQGQQGPPPSSSPPPSHRGHAHAHHAHAHAHSRNSSYTTAGHPAAPPHALAPHPYASSLPPSAPAPPPGPGPAPQTYGHHAPPPVHSGHGAHPINIPPVPYPGQHAQHQGPMARGSAYMDPVRREEELHRYPSPGQGHAPYGYPPPPQGQGRDERGYERRYDERR